MSDTNALFALLVLIFGPALVLGLLVQGVKEIWVDEDPIGGTLTLFLGSIVFWVGLMILHTYFTH